MEPSRYMLEVHFGNLVWQSCLQGWLYSCVAGRFYKKQHGGTNGCDRQLLSYTTLWL